MSNQETDKDDSDEEVKDEVPDGNVGGLGGYESSSSSSGDEDSERCAICLLRLKLQPIGRPENCKHLFCLACITQWSQVNFRSLNPLYFY